MICPYCSEWNCMDANYCHKCGNDLKSDHFRLNKFFTLNKDLFIVFGVFGAFSLYLTTFLNGNTFSTAKVDYSFTIGEFVFNYIKFGIAACLLILLILSIIIILQAIQVPPNKRNIIYYTTGTGSIERLLFIIPFTFFIFGISAYLCSTFYGEIGVIIPIFSFVLGFCVFFILIGEILKTYGKSLKVFLIVSFVLTMFVGYNQQTLLPKLPSTNILLNSFVAFNAAFGQGISLVFIFSVLWGMFEILKIVKNKLTRSNIQPNSQPEMSPSDPKE